MDVFTNNSEAKLEPVGIHVHDFSLLGLRWLVAIAIVYFQGWDLIKSAWNFIWSKVAWPLVEQFDAISVPIPTVLAPTFAILLFLVAFCLFLGFLTRINALIGLALCLFILLTHLELSADLTLQALVLYAGALLVLTLSGGGRLSLDALLSHRRASE